MVSRGSTWPTLEGSVDTSLSVGQLCGIIEGVAASLVTRGPVVRAIVSAEALRHQFGASLEPTLGLRPSTQTRWSSNARPNAFGRDGHGHRRFAPVRRFS